MKTEISSGKAEVANNCLEACLGDYVSGEQSVWINQ